MRIETKRAKDYNILPAEAYFIIDLRLSLERPDKRKQILVLNTSRLQDKRCTDLRIHRLSPSGKPEKAY